IAVSESSTRKEELLLDEKELNRTWILRKLLDQMPALEAMEFLQDRLKNVDTNEDFLNSMSEPIL
ncbi:TPA: transcription termination factor Rho, partial [Candidatus Latescibacteria bacterium]|nr:transcription termination factor Rho [Candidatus Latescibacterota bacterium]